MRILPLVLATLDDDAAFRQQTLEQCHLTHNHPLSDAASLALGRMAQRLLRGGDPAGCRVLADELVKQVPAFAFERYRGQSSAYIVDTMQTVLHFFFRATDFESCLIATVNQGGDADTTGAIVGMLCGAAFGLSAIPTSWLRRLDRKVAAEIHRQVPALLKLSA